MANYVLAFSTFPVNQKMAVQPPELVEIASINQQPASNTESKTGCAVGSVGRR
jgi:hypothetical protein